MKQLLNLLQKDGKLSVRELAVMLSMSEEAVATQIAQLEQEGIIKGYQCVVDWAKVEQTPIKALIELKVTPQKGKGFDEIAQTIVEFHEVEGVHLMSGAFDLAVFVKGENFREVAMFVAEKLSTIENVIATSTIFELRTYKANGISFLQGEEDKRRLVL